MANRPFAQSIRSQWAEVDWEDEADRIRYCRMQEPLIRRYRPIFAETVDRWLQANRVFGGAMAFSIDAPGQEPSLSVHFFAMDEAGNPVPSKFRGRKGKDCISYCIVRISIDANPEEIIATLNAGLGYARANQCDAHSLRDGGFWDPFAPPEWIGAISRSHPELGPLCEKYQDGDCSIEEIELLHSLR